MGYSEMRIGRIFLVVGRASWTGDCFVSGDPIRCERPEEVKQASHSEARGGNGIKGSVYDSPPGWMGRHKDSCVEPKTQRLPAPCATQSQRKHP